MDPHSGGNIYREGDNHGLRPVKTFDFLDREKFLEIIRQYNLKGSNTQHIIQFLSSKTDRTPREYICGGLGGLSRLS